MQAILETEKGHKLKEVMQVKKAGVFILFSMILSLGFVLSWQESVFALDGMGEKEENLIIWMHPLADKEIRWNNTSTPSEGFGHLTTWDVLTQNSTAALLPAPFKIDPNGNSGPYGQYDPGCVNTAMGQMMYHLLHYNDKYKHLSSTIKSKNLWKPSTLALGYTTSNYVYSMVPVVQTRFKDQYEWAAMPSRRIGGDIGNLLEIRRTIAPLLLDIGIHASPFYHLNTATSPDHVDGFGYPHRTDVVIYDGAELMKDFGFEHAVHFGASSRTFVAKEPEYTTDKWKDKIRRVVETNLDYGHPVQLDEAQHAVVIEGYAKSKKQYHELLRGDNWRYAWRKAETYYLVNNTDGQEAKWHHYKKILPVRVLFNVFPKIPQEALGVQPEILSGRVVPRLNEQDAQKQRYVRIIWGEREIATVSVNVETGVYSSVVPSGAQTLKLMVLDSNKEIDRNYGSIYRSIKQSKNLGFYMAFVGNVHEADFLPSNVGLTASQSENAAPIMEAKDTSYRALTAEELSVALASRNSGLNSPRGNPLSEDFALRDLDTILVATDPQFDVNGNGSYLNAVVNTKKFVEAGGTLVATGKSTAFPSLLGGAGSPRFYSFTSLPRPYGASTTISATRVHSQRIIEALGGVNQFTMQSTLPHNQHSVIDTFGKATPLASTNYVFEDIVSGPWGLEWTSYVVPAFNVIEYEQGSKGGKVIYMHGELDANYNAGGLSRAFVDALLDPVIYKADDNEEVASDIGGAFYENPDAKPIGSNSMNLNMVVYKGGIELNNSEINKDISLVFTVTERYAPNSLAPQIDSSGEPELVLSLYKPDGQLYKTCSAISGDSTVSIGVPAAQNTTTGNWKYVVNAVHGFDGNRVVLMAAVDGLYNMNAEAWAEFLDSLSDDIDPDNPPTSDDVTSYDIIWRGRKSASSFSAPAMLPAAPVYPRGIVNGTFYHQLGDRRNTVSRSSVEKISFGPLVKSKDVNIWRMDDDLVLDIKGTTERVTVPGWFADNGKVSGVAFADGSALSASDIASRAVEHEPEIDITPISIDNRITGTDGNDTLFNNGKDAKILGGKGDDTITATGGNNVFYYRMGDGNDTLVVTSVADNVNILRFHTDIASTDVTAKREGDDMKLTIGNGSVTIQGWYANAASKIDRVEFFGGTVFDDRDLERMASGKPMVERVYYLAGPDDVNDDAQKDDTTTKQGIDGGSGSSGCNAGVLPLLAILGFATLIAKKRRA